MDQIITFFQKLLEAENWPPRWICGKWTEFHGWLYIISDLTIWAAYFAIPLILFIFIQKRKEDLPFVGIFWLFILFILSCGTTHLVDAMLFYYPAYRLSALVLFICAIVSWAAIIGLIKILPEALALKTPTQLEAVVQKRTAELEKATNNLARQNEKLRSFTEITSHNLRSPVSNLITLLDLHDVEEDSSKKGEYMQKFKGESEKLMKTINELSEVLKVKNDTDVKLEKVHFKQVMDSTLESLSAIIRQKDAKVTCDFSACAVIEYNRAYLNSIFINLLTNALKYSSDERKPEVHFSNEVTNGTVTIYCRDNGQGIDMNKYGDKVFQLHKTFHNHPESRGVGLYIVKTQVENLGGSVAVKSKVGEGSEFIINLNAKCSDGKV